MTKYKATEVDTYQPSELDDGVEVVLKIDHDRTAKAFEAEMEAYEQELTRVMCERDAALAKVQELEAIHVVLEGLNDELRAEIERYKADRIEGKS